MQRTVVAPRAAGGAGQRSRAGRTRRAILDATAHVLATQGYAALRIHDIASVARVRPSAIYYYFESRDELVEEVLWHGMSSLRQHVASALDAAPAGTTGLARMAIAAEAHLRLEVGIADYAQASVRNAGHVPAALRRRNVEEQARYRALWQGLLEDSVVDGSVPPHPGRDLMLRFALGSLNWTAEWLVPSQRGIETALASARTFVCRGLSAPPRPVVDDGRAGPDAPYAIQEAGTRDRVLAAGAWVLRHRGYGASHLAEIAEMAAVRAPALYHYFPSRQELLLAVMTEGHRRVHLHVSERLASLPSAATTRDTVEAAVAAHLEVQLELSDFAAAAVRNAGQAPASVRAAVAAAASPYHDLWRQLIGRAATEGLLHDDIDPSVGRMLVHGALNWAAEWWHPGMSMTAAIRAGSELIANGLLQQRPTPTTRPSPSPG